MKALILVDLQNDFVEGGALPVPGGRELVPLINQLQERFDFIVATQDWHPADHGSFACHHPGREIGEIAPLGGLAQMLWPAHCVENTPGADFLPGLQRDRWTAVFKKGCDPGIDSYSGFFDNGKHRTTGMDDFLKDHGIREVFIAGLATDYCVKFTALDACALGFTTHVVVDACRGVNLRLGDVNAAVSEMEQAGIRILRTDEIFKP